jgi:CRP-like cAMP-binding protein
MKHEELTGEELSGIALFEGLPESELRSCAELMRRTEVLMGNKLTTEADFGYSFFVVLKGRVRVSAGNAVLAEIAAGDHFGEVSLLHHDKRNATVVALETCELAKVMAWDFDTFKNVSPKLVERLEVAAGERSTPTE